MRRKMKKINTLLFIMVGLCLGLVGCGESKDAQEVWEMDQAGQKMTMTLQVEGDKVTKQETASTLKYADIGIDQETAKAQFDAVADGFKDVEGLDYTVEYNDDDLTQTVIVDFSKIDTSALADLPGFGTGEQIKDGGVSLEEAQKSLEAMGAKKVK